MPCPLERRYWYGFIHPQLELVSRVLNETGAVGGAALELETYCFYSIYPGMASQKQTFCYCDHCFYGFVRSLGKPEAPDAISPGRSFDWLTQHGLRLRFEKHPEDDMAGLIGEVMGEVRKINSDFLFGMYPYAPFGYYDALIRGSGTPELPCLLFPSAEYYSGYRRKPNSTFFGDATTSDSIAHLRRRDLPALYAGGIWNFSNEALVTATDQLVREADGYWMYTGRWPQSVKETVLKLHPAMSRWTKQHRGRVPDGDLHVDAMGVAQRWVEANQPDGITVSIDGIATQYDGEADEVSPVASGFEQVETVAKGWQGRGELPLLDSSVSHTGESSIRFEPTVQRPSPTSPYIDQQVVDAVKGKSY